MAIQVASRSYTKEEILDLLDPAVARWFSTYQKVTPPQQYAIANIQAGNNTLIASPTGSGKTLSAFLSVLNELVTLGRKGKLEDRVYCVYVSPLKSLNNDVQKNLNKPLGEIRNIIRSMPRRGRKSPENFQDIRVAVRTGDTSQSDRSKMLHNPPHILITTPESLAILLVAPKFREHLRKIKWVIIDEIHELCSSKRGVHLSLSLERLQSICESPFARIGLSATIHPLNEVARYLVGYESQNKERECIICDTRFIKRMEVTISAPTSDLVHSDYDTISSGMYSRIKRSIYDNSTTLIFTNTRSGTERLVYQLSKQKIIDEKLIAAHHGSLSKDIRLQVEDSLKQGKMKAVVTSTSLELGLDIGSIDMVLQLGSPKSVTRFLQRVGRSGHSMNQVSRGLVLALDRDDLIEVAAMSSESARGNLDRLYFPTKALDVLAQHIVGMSVEKKWSVADAFDLVRKSYCYHDLDLESFRRVLRYLAGGYQTFDNYRIYGKIWHDEPSDTFSGRGIMTRVIYCTNIGTIPDEVSVGVFERGSDRWVGQIQEEFLERMAPGDIFVLGGKLFKFAYARGMKATVDPVDQGNPTIPVWSSESLSLSFDLGEAVSRFRFEILAMIEAGKNEVEICAFIQNETSCDQLASDAILSYCKAQHAFLRFAGVKEIPDERTIVVENYFDPDARQNLIFDCVFGRRVNDALARAVANSISEKRHGVLQVTVSDNGFMITLPAGVYVNPEHVLDLMPKREQLRASLTKAIRRSEMVRRRFRHCCGRSLMVLRNYKGKGNSVGRQQVSSQILMSICERLEGFPILEEAYREVMEDVMDVNTAEQVVSDIEMGKRRFLSCRRETVPSPFSHNLVLRGSTDIVSVSGRKEMLQSLYDRVMKKVYASKVQHS
ncbi:MAG: ATP-dependent helicase [Nitrososphaerales archaeon]